jgi:hypothetical protein
MTDVQRRSRRIVGAPGIRFGEAAERQHIRAQFDDVDRVDGRLAGDRGHGRSPRLSVTMTEEKPRQCSDRDSEEHISIRYI